MSTCYNCFRDKPDEAVCPYCGFDDSDYAEKHPLALKLGAILDGQYIIGRVLGQGGFGVTYIAQDYNTQNRVAIKEFFPTDFVGRTQKTCAVQLYSGNNRENFEYGKQQFLAEAKALASFIGDEHIVRVHKYFEENGTAYFAMEYVEGLPLDKYMGQQGGRVSPEEADRLFLPLMESVDRIHRRGLVHRDIAPDNIIIQPDGSAKLIDFGAARYSTGERSRSLDVILKHGFAPREQYASRGRQGPFTDVYAMAATYYYAITGKIPPDAMDRQKGNDPLILPKALGVEISKETEKALCKALEPDHGSRFQSMEEFRKAMSAGKPEIPRKTDADDGSEATLAVQRKPAGGESTGTNGGAVAKPVKTQPEKGHREKSLDTGTILCLVAAVLMFIALVVLQNSGTTAGIGSSVSGKTSVTATPTPTSTPKPTSTPTPTPKATPTPTPTPKPTPTPTPTPKPTPTPTPTPKPTPTPTPEKERKKVYQDAKGETVTEEYDKDGVLIHKEEPYYENGRRTATLCYDRTISCSWSGDRYTTSSAWTIPVLKPDTALTRCLSFTLKMKYLEVADSRELGTQNIYCRQDGVFQRAGYMEIGELNTFGEMDFRFNKPTKVDGFGILPYQYISSGSFNLVAILEDVRYLK
ncbi:MAG: serine/threonine protein kinase [Oscillospiraceae bacterium]|nr:serine/threonine protein kinase [Oscillospiraceae bacterium]